MSEFKTIATVSEVIAPVVSDGRIIDINIICSPVDINGNDRPVTTAELDAIRGLVESQLQQMGLETSAVSASAKILTTGAPENAALRVVVRHELEQMLN